MKAIVTRSGPSGFDFSLEEVDEGFLGPTDVRVAVHSAAVNFADTLIMRGEYQIKTPVPFIPGSECAGVVEAVGGAVDTLAVGDRVCAYGFVADADGARRPLGAFAERVTAPAAKFVAAPGGMNMDDAAIFRLSYETAYYGLAHRASLQPGETLLVLGAAGATGFAAIEIGRALGAHVIASASSEEKRSLARLAGATATIDSGASDWRSQIDEATQQRGVDVVFDTVGGRLSELAFRALRRGGRHLVIGFAAGSIPALPLNLALMKDAALLGANNSRFQAEDPTAAAADRKTLLLYYERGQICLPQARAYFNLHNFADAYHIVRAGKTVGRVLLRPRET